MATTGPGNDEAIRAANAAAAVYAWQRGVRIPPGLPDYDVERVFDCCAGDTGFFAAAFRHKTSKALILSVCGANDSRDFAAAANLALCQYEANRHVLIDYLSHAEQQDIILAGHSLGGALCQYLAYDLVRDQLEIGERLRVFTFNGLGGRSGITRLHGAVDPNVVAKISAVHFAHPDDVIPRIGGNLSGQLHLIADEDPLIAPMRDCHRMNVFLLGEGSPIQGSVARDDQPFTVAGTAGKLGPLARQAIIDWISGRRIVASVKILRMWSSVPQDERRAVLRMLVGIAGLPRISQRAISPLLQLYRRVRVYVGPGGPKP
jgi:hypothetical protein